MKVLANLKMLLKNVWTSQFLPRAFLSTKSPLSQVTWPKQGWLLVLYVSLLVYVIKPCFSQTLWCFAFQTLGNNKWYNSLPTDSTGESSPEFAQRGIRGHRLCGFHGGPVRLAALRFDGGGPGWRSLFEVVFPWWIHGKWYIYLIFYGKYVG